MRQLAQCQSISMTTEVGRMWYTIPSLLLKQIVQCSRYYFNFKMIFTVRVMRVIGTFFHYRASKSAR
jgi:hypothetical protein